MRRFPLYLMIKLVFMFVMLPAPALAERQVKVAYDPHLPPLHAEGGDGPYGFVIDIFSEVAERKGWDAHYVPMTQRQAIEAIDQGKVDIFLSLPFKESYANRLEFTDSILGTSIGLIVATNNEEIQGLPDLANKVTALQADTLEYEFLRNIRGIRYHVTSHQEAGIELLQNDRAEAFIGSVLTANYLLEQKGLSHKYRVAGNYLLPLDYTIAVQKENYPLLMDINDGLRELKSDGTYSTLYRHWFNGEQLVTERLWLAIQIIGVLLLIALILFFLGIRWNRQLQKEVAKKTVVLHELNRTLEKQIEETRNSNEFQRQILNSSPRGIATVNREGIITSFNPKAAAIVGTTRETVGLHFGKVSLLKKLLIGKVQTVFTEKQRFLGEETKWERADGRTIYLRYYVYPVFDVEGNVTGTIVTFEDISEERQLRMQIFEQEKSRALIRVVAGIAHEVRNPLTSIKTFVELIPKKLCNERFQKEISTYVPQEIERVSTLIEGLIDYAKPKQPSREMIDLAELARECMLLFDRTVTNRGFTMDGAIEGPFLVKADPNQLKQVVMNLMINSLDAMEEKNEEGLRLSIRVYQLKQEYILEVKDEGVGMTEVEQKQALEPFFTTKAKGTGLGLAIANQYVQENGGRLVIRTTARIGTTISLYFPMIREGTTDETNSHN
ncbi:transporter substrate-binding domain-containing protein [Halalkalibacterium halodurans]|uniref:transporter substrate-binding domain-containing protein n=1 Tax=Halalkalibacterium halodurans TaxID=86665 RepID=UPI001068C538|nr:transporter substrate-binding domain-containing protein [Halalkalibacterium halodurans]TES53778.1 transporter substrate-binding domain-containing protein [Halalkalibacterium halodurans]